MDMVDQPSQFSNIEKKERENIKKENVDGPRSHSATSANPTENP
jgi:hypothetical protein